MKYKVGDKVKFVKDCALTDGNVIPYESVWVVRYVGKDYYDVERVDTHLKAILAHELADNSCEKINAAPSITKRINDKHNILNGLLNSDGSVDGEKLMEKLESNSKDSTQKEKFKVGDKLRFVKEYKFPRGGSVLKGSVWDVAEVNIEIYTLLYVGGENSISGKCGYNINLPLEVLTSHCEKVEDSEESKTKGSHYEKASMQPLEVMQRIMTQEQFKGFLLGNYIKYRLRSEFKGQHDSDEYKARQYAYWLEMVKDGHIINPSKDKVPYDYKFSII